MTIPAQERLALDYVQTMWAACALQLQGAPEGLQLLEERFDGSRGIFAVCVVQAMARFLPDDGVLGDVLRDLQDSLEDLGVRRGIASALVHATGTVHAGGRLNGRTDIAAATLAELLHLVALVVSDHATRLDKDPVAFAQSNAARLAGALYA